RLCWRCRRRRIGRRRVHRVVLGLRLTRAQQTHERHPNNNPMPCHAHTFPSESLVKCVPGKNRAKAESGAEAEKQRQTKAQSPPRRSPPGAQASHHVPLARAAAACICAGKNWRLATTLSIG